MILNGEYETIIQQISRAADGNEASEDEKRQSDHRKQVGWEGNISAVCVEAGGRIFLS